jgi:hypothetical protein
MSDKFDVKINSERGSYYLSTTRNGYQWTSVSIGTLVHMCKIAKALIKQAHELVSDYCPVCGTELDTDYEAIGSYEAVIDALTPDYLVLWCENCEQSFNSLGEEL